MTARHPGAARAARILAPLTIRPFLGGLLLAPTAGAGALGAGLLLTVAVGSAAVALGAYGWGRLDLGITPAGVLLWLLIGGGLAAFVIGAALAWRSWTF